MVDAEFTFHSRFPLAAANASGVPRDALAKRVRGAFLRLAERLDPTVTLELARDPAVAKLAAPLYAAVAAAGRDEAVPLRVPDQNRRLRKRIRRQRRQVRFLERRLASLEED